MIKGFGASALVFLRPSMVGKANGYPVYIRPGREDESVFLGGLMFVLGNLIAVIAKILSIALNIYMWIIIIRALLSWVNPDPYNPIVMFLYRITEPVLSFVRRKLPIGSFGIDFSPMIVILIIWLLQEFLVRTLLEMSLRFH
jgi:YggT family protein